MLNLIPIEKIENKILLMRGMKVMLDRDLAELYGVETRILNQAVKRNKKRFPDDFMFQLTRMEAEYLASEGYLGGALRSQIVTLKKENANNKEKTGILISQIVISRWGGTKKLPYVFTEQGVAMLSSILKSERAIEMNIIIMRAFVKIRNLIYSYKDLAEKVEKHSRQIGKIFEILGKMKKTENEERQEIGFKG
ncbi:MAG: ORF6N domain-containing protein [Patescibacteria group bacterium]|nr:ORF6N domain-containing protein [Patescibacteria group bacterium]